MWKRRQRERSEMMEASREWWRLWQDIRFTALGDGRVVEYGLSLVEGGERPTSGPRIAGKDDKRELVGEPKNTGQGCVVETNRDPIDIEQLIITISIIIYFKTLASMRGNPLHAELTLQQYLGHRHTQGNYRPKIELVGYNGSEILAAEERTVVRQRAQEQGCRGQHISVESQVLDMGYKFLAKRQAIEDSQKNMRTRWRRNSKKHEVVAKDQSQYLPLFKAALKGDWESARRFLNQDEDALTAKITALLMTALHVVVGTGKAIHFVENLVNLIPNEALALYDDYGNTPLHVAALVGNTETAIILMRKNPALLHMGNNRGWLPVHRAALNAHRNTLLYLLAAHKDNMDSKSLADQSSVELLVSVTDSGFFDVAMSLVQHYPELVTLKLENGDYALKAIARKASAFPSGSALSGVADSIFEIESLSKSTLMVRDV
ncbi:hypothetical protein RJ640_020173 [Escallonia rubra]|uniref:Uncharacterized protein n=1 Tax=Escallonia rubra TaxID=112253 RepID=A0AA88RU16_9ASTE|nr:hypothetical protein RJ640_020173 [Escallonia rubra]